MIVFHPIAFRRERQGASKLPGLNDFGRKLGCHTCGTRNAEYYVGDHMPPNKFARPGQLQRFYPQCRECSNLQGNSKWIAKAKEL